ncbi:MAG: hypothetical protein ABIX44_05015, partial [Cryobacterium sp.]
PARRSRAIASRRTIPASSRACGSTSRSRTAPSVRALEAALDALEADHDFLLAGNVFTPELIDTWIGYKREHEIKPLAQRPHPFEFELYYGV